MDICDKNPEKHRGKITLSVARYDKLGRLLCNVCLLPENKEPNIIRQQEMQSLKEEYDKKKSYKPFSSILRRETKS